MSNLSPYKMPGWMWLSIIPIFGGLAIAYGGKKINNQNLIGLGIGFTAAAIVCSSTQLVLVIWLAQIATAFYLNQQTHSLANSSESSRGYAIADRKTAALIASKKGQIDINTCSKDELVYELGLPIVYANDIEAARQEGYMFTHLEELHEIAGIPENYLYKIEPLISFGYYLHKEVDSSWRRLNAYSETELIECGIHPEIAQKIVSERAKNGFYRSLIDVKNRTGIPIRNYHGIGNRE
ncbi:helix-hairpin-helix domain-containing protein [Gloeothece verrucosa]|uniref:ComEA protein n=1 Tax=Gloeothece verrucosa (strain PCC 7822) TaxID=497965 RepID=E0U8V1_GLOV7|nr:helix-hairpin-helix domain-containing protein [Gloeothece verrucosa]ADN14965.1 conserved hypothetical protein [Gloeothece verrucosa PCC 7822]